MDRNQICCFTGHRPHRLPWGEDESDERCIRFKQTVYLQLERLCEQGCKHFVCGMALGADIILGELVVQLKKYYSDILLEAALPYSGQARQWSAVQKERHQRLLQQCDLETVIQESYSRGCALRRDDYMVERAGKLIAIYDGTPKGGTYHTLLYAIRQGLEIYQFNPYDF